MAFAVRARQRIDGHDETGLAVGLVLGSAAVAYGYALGDLVQQGASCGVAVGVVPSAVLGRRLGLLAWVWPIGLTELTRVLRGAGLAVTWQQEHSSAHHAIATALHRCYRADESEITGQTGAQATADLISAHRLWGDWLGSGRVRKFAIVAEKQ